MASVSKSGDMDYTLWPSTTGHPFNVRFVGKGIYEGRAEYGQGSWGGTDYGGPGHIDADGTVQNVMFKVEGNHRPVRFEFYHTDGTNPSVANYNLTIEYRSKGTHQWHQLDAAVPNVITYHAEFGETWERLSSDYRITLQATNGHDIYIVPRMQVLKQDRVKLIRRNP